MGNTGSRGNAGNSTAVAASVDALALAALHSSLGGAHWRSSANWLQREPCGGSSSEFRPKWEGVRCHAGNVDGLMLSDNDLAGRVPTQIGVLTHLQELRLNSGSIS
eukprot:3986873-Prymnesium_polylepis.1